MHSDHVGDLPPGEGGPERFVPKADAVARALTPGVIACPLSWASVLACLGTWRALPGRVCSARRGGRPVSGCRGP
jgi:hypothetical protein